MFIKNKITYFIKESNMKTIASVLIVALLICTALLLAVALGSSAQENEINSRPPSRTTLVGDRPTKGDPGVGTQQSDWPIESDTYRNWDKVKDEFQRKYENNFPER